MLWFDWMLFVENVAGVVLRFDLLQSGIVLLVDVVALEMPHCTSIWIHAILDDITANKFRV